MSDRRLDVLDAALDTLEASQEELEALVRALLPRPAESPEALRARLLASLAETHRFGDLEAQVASLLDVDGPTAARLLLSVDRPESWSAGPTAGVTLFHVEGGPRVADAVTGFVRVDAGAAFPEHEHLGDEIVLVLQGALEDSLGRVVRQGEAAAMAAHSAHAFRVLGTLPLLYLAVIQRGVRIGDVTILPGDPRG